jgi:hypothetical protein
MVKGKAMTITTVIIVKARVKQSTLYAKTPEPVKSKDSCTMFGLTT